MNAATYRLHSNSAARLETSSLGSVLCLGLSVLYLCVLGFVQQNQLGSPANLCALPFSNFVYRLLKKTCSGEWFRTYLEMRSF